MYWNNSKEWQYWVILEGRSKYGGNGLAIQKGMALECNALSHKIENIWYNFLKFRNGLYDKKKIPENTNYTIMKYGETFYGRHSAQTPAIHCSNDVLLFIKPGHPCTYNFTKHGHHRICFSLFHSSRTFIGGIWI